VYDESGKAAVSPVAVGGGGGDLHRLKHQLRDKLEIKSDKSSEGVCACVCVSSVALLNSYKRNCLAQLPCSTLAELSSKPTERQERSTQFTCFTGTKVRKLNALYTLMSLKY
jgi:hypothetical protein